MKLRELLEKEEKGLYAAVKFSSDTIQKIIDFAGKSIPNLLKKKDFHSTLIYSRKPVKGFKPTPKLNEFGQPTKFEIWESPPNAFKKEKTYCLVMKYDCNYMHNRWKEAMDMGATYDYDEYKPHVTLSYDVGKDFKISDLPSISKLGELKITNEYSEDLDVDKTF